MREAERARVHEVAELEIKSRARGVARCLVTWGVVCFARSTGLLA